jgi:hypothetical protein
VILSGEQPTGSRSGSEGTGIHHLNAGLKRLIDQQKREVQEKDKQITALVKQVDELKRELRTTISAKDAVIETKESRNFPEGTGNP